MIAKIATFSETTKYLGMKKTSERISSEVFAMIPDALLREWEWSEAHATRGCDGREKGCESGYYDLHRYLDDAFLHLSFTSLLNPEKRSARGSSPQEE